MTRAKSLAMLIDQLQSKEQIRDDDPCELAVGPQRVYDLFLAAASDHAAVVRLEQDRRSHGWRGLIVTDLTDQTPQRWVAQSGAPAVVIGEADREWRARLIAVLKTLQHDA